MMAMHRSLSREGGDSKVEVYAMYRLFVVCCVYASVWVGKNKTKPSRKKNGPQGQ
jgi:hypothetical protein